MPRLAPGPGEPRRLPTSRGAALPRARGAPARRRRGPRDLDRPPLRRRRLRLVVPGRRRDPDRGRLLRPAFPRPGDDRAPDGGSRRRTPSATRAIGFPTSCAVGPKTASSSRGTRPGTASPSPPRGSGPRSTSGPSSAAELRGVVEGRQDAQERLDTAPSTTTTAGSSAACCWCKERCRWCRPACWPRW